MGIIEKGLFFLDHHAVRDFKEKSKFIIVLTDGEDEEDLMVCFSLNTEHRMDLYHLGCNKQKQKFILSPDLNKFSFLTEYTYIKLDEPLLYQVKELFDDNIKVFEKDKATSELLRQIKNCIDIGYLLPKHVALIKNSFETKK